MSITATEKPIEYTCVCICMRCVCYPYCIIIKRIEVPTFYYYSIALCKIWSARDWNNCNETRNRYRWKIANFFFRKMVWKKRDSDQISLHSIHNNWNILYIRKWDGPESARLCQCYVRQCTICFQSLPLFVLNWIGFSSIAFFLPFVFVLAQTILQTNNNNKSVTIMTKNTNNNNNNVIHLGNHFHRMLNYTTYIRFTHCIKNTIGDGMCVQKKSAVNEYILCAIRTPHSSQSAATFTFILLVIS